MADIGIEKKKPIWPWIILVLVILAILYFFLFADDNNPDDMNNKDNIEQVQDTTIWETETQDTANWDLNTNDNTMTTPIDTTGMN